MTNSKAENQRAIALEEAMLVNPHVAYTKKIGIDKERIRRALIRQLETCNSKFTNRRDMLNVILDLPQLTTEENGKCIKCKREQRNAICMSCSHLVLC